MMKRIKIEQILEQVREAGETTVKRERKNTQTQADEDPFIH
jgi:hypothetical protein